MKYRYFIALLLSACFMQHAAMAAPRAKRNVNQVITTLPENIFELAEIPENYRKGVSQAAVLKQAEALGNLSKGEFEKSDEFKMRQQSALDASALAPGKGPLGFVVDGSVTGIEFSYNADTSQYQVKQSSLSRFCQSTPTFSLPKGTPYTLLCVVGILDHKESTYNGQNAFGVSAEVDKETGTYVSISIPFASRFFTQLNDHIYNYKDAVDFPSDQARKYKTADLKLMLVGRIDGVGTIRGQEKIMRPRLDSTFDVFIDNKGLPFKLDAVIYFFQSDGKILAIRDMRMPN